MRRDYFLVWAGLATVTAVLAAIVPVVAGVAAAVLAGGGVLYWVGRCRHGGRLGLLPPTTDAEGVRTSARWYCDACGRSWPAGLESDRAPVVRFSGYDQTKLPAAARRAAAFAKQRQSLAVRRAGLTTPHVRTPAAANVTSISQRRTAR